MTSRNKNIELEEKIRKLFEYRKLPDLISSQSKNSEAFYEDLISLQVSIYNLDSYLEENWNLKQKLLKKCWKDINANLSKFHLSQSEIWQMASHIRRYQKHEIQLRSGLFPTRLNQEYYYHYKSCDVRLLRELIYREFPNLEKAYPLKDWRYFDIVTEVNDDVEDVFEDQFTINGNFFLISIIEFGLKKTKNQFRSFLKEIDKKNNRIPKTEMTPWFKTYLKDTQNLLKINAQTISQKSIPLKSLLFDN